jgi:hypothetical protein
MEKFMGYDKHHMGRDNVLENIKPQENIDYACRKAEKDFGFLLS